MPHASLGVSSGRSRAALALQVHTATCGTLTHMPPELIEVSGWGLVQPHCSLHAGQGPRPWQGMLCHSGGLRACVWAASDRHAIHPPPFWMQNQLLSKATDVYSFGCLCYEMVTSQRAWAGRSPVQVLYARSQGERLRAPDACPPGFKVGWRQGGVGRGPCGAGMPGRGCWARAGFPQCLLAAI